MVPKQNGLDDSGAAATCGAAQMSELSGHLAVDWERRS